ncbi:endonuclease/exonuclease/phosphatase family protein [Streptomyces sp. XY431]|uniref:endonuclease/exonuclease/phosphatase family protein n=1 Tax=Streptomyces sp. XY431 TaxID=1415562 RepID=UPI0006AF854B|nr:endonuclease/exonuclease/phosphatase family protein [Streptomyces sp. XY431]
MRLANLNAYKVRPGEEDSVRSRARVATIQEMAPDVLTIQEVLVDTVDQEGWDDAAEEILRRLAADCGLACSVPDGPAEVAMAHNVHQPWYTAILWNPDTVAPIRGSFRAIGAPDFWHGITTLGLDVGAREPLTVASYHGDPFRPDARYNEALRLKGFYRRTSGVKSGVLLGDFNSISAASSPTGGYYDTEPYTRQDHDDLEYQCVPETIGGSNLADRRPSAALLRRGFMADAAAYLGAPWQPTVGYWRDGEGDPDPWGERRIDLILPTRPVAPALTGYGVHVSEASAIASDHRPVWIDLDPSNITTEGAA